MLGAEREALLSATREGRLPAHVARQVEVELDLEQLLLSEQDRDQVGPASLEGEGIGESTSCQHLRAADQDVPANTPRGCQDCLRDGTAWVHLRLCLGCGHVGCCDSSPNRHATAHFDRTLHPVIRSYGPGETWRWCYLDRIIG